jgi:hypothetical protein
LNNVKPVTYEINEEDIFCDRLERQLRKSYFGFNYPQSPPNEFFDAGVKKGKGCSNHSG